MSTVKPPASPAAPPVQRKSVSPPPLPAAPTPSARSFLQRHPAYAAFITALEIVAVACVVCGVVGALFTWWSVPSLADRQAWNDYSAIHFSEGFVSLANAVSVLFGWLALAGSVAAISMVGRLLLSIEGHMMRVAEKEGSEIAA